MDTIHKAGALIFQDKKLLIVRPKDKPYYISPGGKYEKGENVEDCLRREIKEELDSMVISFRHYKTYHIDKAAHSDLPLLLEFYIVEIDSTPKPSSEIETIAWFSKEDFNNKTFNVPPSFSIFIPDLIKDGLL